MRHPFQSVALTLSLALAACGGGVAATPSKGIDGGSTGKDGGHDARRDVVTAAHGDATTDALDDAMTDALDDAMTDALDDACPTARPNAGSRCAFSGYADCEYGSDPEPSCDTIVECVAGGWTTSSEPEDAGCGTTNSPLCPAAFSDVTDQGPCAADASGLAGVECYYPEARCWCSLGTAPATWQCDITTMPGCPEPRPRIGTPCDPSDAALFCNYASCTGQACRAGTWQFVYWCGK